MDIFEEPKNHRVFLDHKVLKKMNFSESRFYMAMQGCISVLRVGAQKSIRTYLKSPKIIESSKTIKFAKKINFSQSRLYMAMQGCILMLSFGAQKTIWVFSKSPKIIESYQTIKFLKRSILVEVVSTWPCRGVFRC